MSLNKLTAARKKMFPMGTRIVWAHDDATAKRLFDELLKAREEYRKAGGTFKKK
jgi:hypothetical protein